jgi:orotidine-5'-phosphate decarboxylase
VSAPSPFPTRLAARVARHGPLCVGIDPSSKLLAQCGLPDDAGGLYDFGRRVLDAARFELSVVKPQLAYFERHGSAGIAALERLLADCRREGVLVLLDGKRGDIDATAEAYADAFSRPGAPLACDAWTSHAYLGFGALARGVDASLAAGTGIFVVVRSSNPEGTPTQTARLVDDRGVAEAPVDENAAAKGRSVAEALADEIAAANQRHAAIGGGIGAVLGATSDESGALAQRMPGAWLLAPGVGAQGATFADVKRRFGSAAARVLPNVSRGILAAGSSSAQIAATLAVLRSDAAILGA